MEQKNKKLFITTAIYYVNATPHLGHSLEEIQADVVARYNRLLGRDVFFLTGSDENSLKNVRAAEKEGISVKDLVDRNAQKFKDLGELLNLSFDDFIRTTEERHIKGVHKLWQECDKKGDIYLDNYEGLYCVGCEAYLAQADLENGLCPEHKTAPEQIKEKNWFFKLSKYQDQIQKAIKEGKLEIIPESRKNEILSFLNQGLKDICVSRSNERAKNWGISVPADNTQKVWCWFDALGNYITALGYGSDEEKFEKYWQKGEVLHVIGKGISRFHAVYWLGILLSAGLKLPDKIFVHGYITVDGQKMSKSLGNVINPFELVEKYTQKIGNKEAAIDAVRYFLLREISPTEDGDFTYEKFEERYNGDLANGIGNLVSRTFTMAEKYWRGVVPVVDITETGSTVVSAYNSGLEAHFNMRGRIEDAHKDQLYFFKEFQFNSALSLVASNEVKACDCYIDACKLYKPSEVLGDDKKRISIALYDVLETIRHIALMFLPFMPETSEKIFEQLGLHGYGEKILKGKIKFEEAIKWGGLKPGTKIKKGAPLFPRL